jgi:hypothetical protein
MKRKQVIRPEDALRHLGRALDAPPKSHLRQSRLEHALLVYYFGKINQQRGSRGDRRHGRQRHDDGEAVSLMKGISEATGDDKPHKLARLAVESGQIDFKGAQPESVIRRLARAYSDRQQK